MPFTLSPTALGLFRNCPRRIAPHKRQHEYRHLNKKELIEPIKKAITNSNFKKM